MKTIEGDLWGKDFAAGRTEVRIKLHKPPERELTESDYQAQAQELWNRLLYRLPEETIEALREKLADQLPKLP